MIVIVVTYAYSVFLPLKLGTAWFYAGLCTYVPSMVIGVMAVLTFAATSVDQPVTAGVYRISRNPMYVGSLDIREHRHSARLINNGLQTMIAYTALHDKRVQNSTRAGIVDYVISVKAICECSNQLF